MDRDIITWYRIRWFLDVVKLNLAWMKLESTKTKCLLKTDKDINLIGIFTISINWDGDDMGGDRYLIWYRSN